MSATTRLVDVSATGAVAEAVITAEPARTRLALQLVVAVALGTLAAVLTTWALLSTMTLHMSF